MSSGHQDYQLCTCMDSAMWRSGPRPWWSTMSAMQSIRICAASCTRACSSRSSKSCGQNSWVLPTELPAFVGESRLVPAPAPAPPCPRNPACGTAPGGFWSGEVCMTASESAPRAAPAPAPPCPQGPTHRPERGQHLATDLVAAYAAFRLLHPYLLLPIVEFLCMY